MRLHFYDNSPVEADVDSNVKQLKVPIWFWNSAEWSAFTQASPKTQRPLLRRALRDIRKGGTVEIHSDEAELLNLRRYLSYQIIALQRDLANNSIKTQATKFGYYLKTVYYDLCFEKRDLYPSYISDIDAITTEIKTALQKSYYSFNKDSETIVNYRPFIEADIKRIIEKMRSLVDSIGGLVYQEKDMGEDIPLPFKVTDFADYVQMLGIEDNTSQFVDFLVMRIRALISDKRICDISDTTEITLAQWLDTYICKSKSSESFITVIDLSLVPAEVIHIITAVIARMILEALQRYRIINNGTTLPTVLVMEEAHTFIKKYENDTDESSASSMCTQVFEKIAREGRKFGLGLVLSSQRPSELSPTVLSQCNTFLLHRINNDRDQDLVKKLLPDNLRGLLRELPSLTPRNAILLGWASELPVLVQMNYLKEEHQPLSKDPDYWDTWTGVKERIVDWKIVADDWQQI